jgi:drug/metabolite transporter (DMT)-like permease
MTKTVLSGVLLTIASYFLFSLQDASVKWLVTDLPVFQILFIRSVVIFCSCLVIGRKALFVRAVTSPVIGPMFIRNLLLLSAWLTYYNAARYLGLAQLTTVYYASPILITLLAVPILKEEIPSIRWLAVIFGFIGVMVAVNPIKQGFTLSLPVGMALLAAVFWACASVLLRKTALHEKTMVQMMLSSGFLVIMTGVASLFFWVPISFTELLLMSSTGLFAGLGQFAMFEGMRRAPVSVLAPFEYTSLIWAFILGFMIWGEIPTHNVFYGAGLIFFAGCIILFGERLLNRFHRPAAPQ